MEFEQLYIYTLKNLNVFILTEFLKEGIVYYYVAIPLDLFQFIPQVWPIVLKREMMQFMW